MAKKKKAVTPDIVIPGETIDLLVKKVITKGFKKNNKLSQRDIEFYKRQVYASIKDGVYQVIKEQHRYEEVRDFIFEHLTTKYSWDKLIEMGIKE